MHDQADPDNQELMRLSPAEQELEGALRTLVPAVPRCSFDEAAFAAGRASMMRYMRMWRSTAAVLLIAFVGTLGMFMLRTAGGQPGSHHVMDFQVTQPPLGAEHVGSAIKVASVPTAKLSSLGSLRSQLHELTDPEVGMDSEHDSKTNIKASSPSAFVPPRRIDRASDVLNLHAEPAVPTDLFRAFLIRGVLQ